MVTCAGVSAMVIGTWAWVSYGDWRRWSCFGLCVYKVGVWCVGCLLNVQAWGAMVISAVRVVDGASITVGVYVCVYVCVCNA